jgi:hypothetical protein
MLVKNMALSLISQEWVEPEQQGQRKTKNYFSKSLDSQFTWILHEAKLKRHILRLTNGLLENNP